MTVSQLITFLSLIDNKEAEVRFWNYEELREESFQPIDIAISDKIILIQ